MSSDKSLRELMINKINEHAEFSFNQTAWMNEEGVKFQPIESKDFSDEELLEMLVVEVMKSSHPMG